MLKDYYRLTKPGIVYGNAISAVAGFFLADKDQLHLFLFLAMLLGTSLIIASSCVLNNYLDREIDAKMARTRNRPSVTGSIPFSNAMIFAALLAISGTLILFSFTNILTVIVGLLGMIFYVLIYGYAKRTTEYGTLIGSISGAMPILGGYTAASNHLDIGALLVFLILIFWQMPHFYAIAIYRREDYQKARIPVLSITRGITTTTWHILFYIVAYTVSSLLLTFFGVTKYLYALSMLLLCLWWIYLALKGFSAENKINWARRVFKFSLIILLIQSALLTFSVVLP